MAIHGSSNEQKARQPVEEQTTNHGRHAIGVWCTEVAVDYKDCAGDRDDIGNERKENESGDKRNLLRGWR